ncbi:MAG: hypothetical protein ACC655_08630 [Rhodothermia bacterium]
MTEIAYTLVAEGSADRALLPILDWILEQTTTVVFQHQWPDLRLLRRPTENLADRIQEALGLAPCDLLFVHRDADRGPRDGRVSEIHGALATVPDQPAVCVIPVGMTETWLLFNEETIRRAAGNPNGTQPLCLPGAARLESLSNPKEALENALRTATGHTGRRLRRWSPAQAVHRLATLIEDYAPLRRLPAFVAFEQELERVLADNNWLM